MDAVSDQKPKVRKQTPERIVLVTPSLEIVKRHQEQIESVFGGLIRLSPKEVTNLILQIRADALSVDELTKIKAEFFDELRAAKWAVKQLEEAKTKGESVSLQDILKKIETPQVKRKRLSKRPKVTISENTGHPAPSSQTASEVRHAVLGSEPVKAQFESGSKPQKSPKT